MGYEGDRHAQETAEAVARRSYGRLVAFLSRQTRDIAAAEDALSEAFAVALREWPSRGCPENPEAWLMAVAKRKIIDVARRRRSGDAASDHLILLAAEAEDVAMQRSEIPDERLALMFACAHPAIDARIRAPLILQTLLGFDAARIASAFLMSPEAMGQRLVRAKSKIRQAGIPFRTPEADELPERLEPVLEAIYAAFGQGWSDWEGAEIQTSDLAQEAIWLGRLVVSLLPDEPEALGLLALMLHCEARRAARRGPHGEYVPLAAQDTAQWAVPLIEEAEMLLFHASRMSKIGRYQIEAAVQSAHAMRRHTGQSDWRAIAKFYDLLQVICPSPVVAINRAVAIAETSGAEAGLNVLDELADDQRLAQYQPYWAACADLLSRTGRIAAAQEAYEQAIGLEHDPAVRAFLQQRQAAMCGRAN